MQDQTSEKLTWTAEHIPISVSICSNVEGFKSPHCIVKPDTNSLIASMVQYMTNIANKSYDLAKAKFCETYGMLDCMIQSELPLIEDSNDDDPILEELILDSMEWQKQEEMHIKSCQKLKEELDSYCRQLPCISFNGSKYDLNLIKKYLAAHLQLHASKTCLLLKETTNTLA